MACKIDKICPRPAKFSLRFFKSDRLLAPDVFANDIFAMKGGTAINLFVQDMPRLSVDIDVAYLPWTTPRDEALVECRVTCLAGHNSPPALRDEQEGASIPYNRATFKNKKTFCRRNIICNTITIRLMPPCSVKSCSPAFWSCRCGR
ncbi:nucleotidyl transferase AbiEii/AbiGii toxin family protein [Sulfuriferula plumbiphila]|uniref:nucleotidyl transferase AbiEii/AbiGii toxin family protein n=1 Tax=Sulfuriferula plumbiphila TaxID=171865 RepID=UPI003FCDD8EF